MDIRSEGGFVPKFGFGAALSHVRKLESHEDSPDCVGDDGAAEAKIALGNRVGHAIARRSDMAARSPAAITYSIVSMRSQTTPISTTSRPASVPFPVPAEDDQHRESRRLEAAASYPPFAASSAARLRCWRASAAGTSSSPW